MIAFESPIVDASGSPIKRFREPPELESFLPRRQQRQMQASYDAASSSTEFSNYWANADNYDADSAMRRDVREKLVARSRYEIGNNGFSDGIGTTYATDTVGIGPKLQMQTASKPFNQMVEREFQAWAKAIGLRRKLWCMAHAKHQDGEGIGVLRTNPKINHAIKIDLVLYETEQCQTPTLGYNEDGYIDGIRFDEFGNAEWYDILKEHPGSSFYTRLNLEPEAVQARYVTHWFRLRRPGQHRAVPECASTLNTGAAGRRWREATIAAAESAADFTMFISTTLSPDEVESVAPMSTLDIKKRMLTALPMGYDARQMKAEQPTATYAEFNKAQVNEQARPKSMPYNKAACDSSSYNYASGRLDHQTYYAALDVDREDCSDLVLDVIFEIWFEEAVKEFQWLGGDPRIIGSFARAHTWDWPKHRVADIVSEAKANDINLHNGSLSMTALYSQNGEDYQDQIGILADDFGLTPEEMKTVLLNELYPHSIKSKIEAYDRGVRAGVITPQIEDENVFRKALGLPPVSESGKAVWEKDGGTRRPQGLSTPDLLEEVVSNVTKQQEQNQQSKTQSENDNGNQENTGE